MMAKVKAWVLGTPKRTRPIAAKKWKFPTNPGAAGSTRPKAVITRTTKLTTGGRWRLKEKKRM
jgi:hypothetical protein